MSTVPAAVARRALRGPPLGVATAFALALSVASSWGAAGDAPPSQHPGGRLLTQVLEELQARGLNLIFSSEVVRPELVVMNEPESGTPRSILDRILPPLGLKAQDGSSGAVLIVRAPPPSLGRIEGRAVESGRGHLIANASVAIEGTAFSTATGLDGRFRLGEVPAGTYSLRVLAPGFLPYLRSDVTVAPDGTAELAIVLEPDPRFVDDIVVTPGHHEIVPQEVGPVRSLDRTDVIASTTPVGDPARIVTLLPGMAAADGSAAFNARGSATKDVVLILDGLQLHDPFHLSAFRSPFSFIDGRVVDAIDVSGGGFTADRGDSNGGFVEISSVPPADSPSTQLELGTLNSRVAYQAPTPFGSLLVSGRYWYPQAVGDTVPFGVDGLDPTFADLYVKLGLLRTSNTAVTGHVLLASDRATLSESDGNERVAASNASTYFWVRALHSWTERFATDTVVSAGRTARFHQGIADLDDGMIAVEDRRNSRFVGLKNDATWTLGGAHVLRGGFDVDFLDAELDHVAGPPGATATVAVNPSGAALGAYLAYRNAIGARLITEAGVRWDRQTYTGDRQWSPRLNLVWLAGKRTELRLAAGSYSQSQRLNALRIEDGETTYGRPEICEQLDLSYIQSFSKGWSLRVDAYRHRFGRLQPHAENLFHPVELFPEVEPDRVLVAPESADLHGAELSVRGDAGTPLQWTVSYTWSKAADIVSGVEVLRSWDQTHAGSFLLAYRWRSGWFLSLGGIVHTGWPTTPVTARAVTTPDGSTELEPVAGPRNSARFPTYARLDVTAGRTIATRKGAVRVELSVVNLTDRQNVCCVDEVRFEEGPAGRVDTQTTFDYWMGIAPSLQVAWTF